MESIKSSSNVLKFFIATASLIVIVAGMRSSQAIMVPFLLSIFITVISAPSFFWLTRKKVPEFAAVMILVVVLMLIALIVGALVGTSINDFAASLPEYQTRLKQATEGVLKWCAELGMTLPEQELLDYFDPGVAMQLAANMFTELSSVLGDAFLILLAVIFMLLEASHFRTKLESAFGANSPVGENLHGFTNSLKQYVAIKTWMSIATGGIVTIGLAIIGLDYPLLWGLLAFLLNYVPNIGSIIAAIPAVLLALISLTPGAALLVVLLYALTNTIIGNIVESRLMGSGLGLSTFVVFFSLVFWGWVLGPVGMLLSVPLTMTVKIAFESNKETKWIAVLLGPGQ